jgi:hypothetical protein
VGGRSGCEFAAPSAPACIHVLAGAGCHPSSDPASKGSISVVSQETNALSLCEKARPQFPISYGAAEVSVAPRSRLSAGGVSCHPSSRMRDIASAFPFRAGRKPWRHRGDAHSPAGSGARRAGAPLQCSAHSRRSSTVAASFAERLSGHHGVPVPSSALTASLWPYVPSATRHAFAGCGWITNRPTRRLNLAFRIRARFIYTDDALGLAGLLSEVSQPGVMTRPQRGRNRAA